jgi:hypothetical protein
MYAQLQTAATAPAVSSRAVRTSKTKTIAAGPGATVRLFWEGTVGPRNPVPAVTSMPADHPAASGGPGAHTGAPTWS